MSSETIGLLHPGAMGASVGAAAQKGGHTVYWASEGRSAQTRSRAEQVGFRDAGTLAELCAVSSVIISVCPPDAAEDVARSVVTQGFRGLYLDANAISPQRAQRLGEMLDAAGITFVDGGITGGPAWQPGTTWLLLSGAGAQQAAALFDAGPLGMRVLSPQVGDASALKMCFAAYTKGSTALLCAAMAAAEAWGVGDALTQVWAQHGVVDEAEQAAQRARGVTAKAWRFAGEMEEIAATFSAVGVPGGFHQAAADLYRRLAGFKGLADLPPIDAVLAALLEAAPGEKDS